MSAGFARILVPTDFSAPSEEAWKTACRLGRVLGAELILVHVFVEPPLYSEGPFSGERVREVYAAGRAWVEKTLEEWAAGARAEGLAARVLVRVGVPHREILALAAYERADLLVVGTHGRGGVERALIGSVADRVIRLAPCPVLSVRGPAEA
ncbi:MAG TPA: universal stress protein [Methylomirabilota bacterium]|nr:universal stress protein [Methylomirabilota bacterium]